MAILGVGELAKFHYRPSSSQPFPSPSESANRTYSNTRYGYSVAYPQGIIVENYAGNGHGDTTATGTDDGVAFYPEANKVNAGIFSVYATGLKGLTPEALSEYYSVGSPTYWTVSPIEIAGTKAVKALETVPDDQKAYAAEDEFDRYYLTDTTGIVQELDVLRDTPAASATYGVGAPALAEKLLASFSLAQARPAAEK